MDPIDFLAVGDIVTEPFIKLGVAETHCDKGAAHCTICLAWGDKIPYESATLVAAVGNASNAAVAAARLGLKSALHAYVGDDRYGPECLEVLAREGVSTEYMVTEPGKKTNYHYVLWYGNERTILVKHEAFTYEVPKLTVQPKWLYLSSLAGNSLPYHLALVEMLDRMPDTKLAFQPGTFQMQLGVEALKPLYEKTALFFCNREEAARILGLDEIPEMAALLDGIHALGPETVVITDGTNGAYALENGKRLTIPMYPDSRGPYERTGAGDAFASTVVCGLAYGGPLERALLWGPINAMAVVQEIGAQKGLLSHAALAHYLEIAPPEYRATEF